MTTTLTTTADAAASTRGGSGIVLLAGGIPNLADAVTMAVALARSRRGSPGSYARWNIGCVLWRPVKLIAESEVQS
jgi:hypothetical protein